MLLEQGKLKIQKTIRQFTLIHMPVQFIDNPMLESMLSYSNLLIIGFLAIIYTICNKLANGYQIEKVKMSYNFMINEVFLVSQFEFLKYWSFLIVLAIHIFVSQNSEKKKKYQEVCQAKYLCYQQSNIIQTIGINNIQSECLQNTAIDALKLLSKKLSDLNCSWLQKCVFQCILKMPL
ncbi:hypothetical protein pb186bvf_018857 [Paramecium bursaria]